MPTRAVRMRWTRHDVSDDGGPIRRSAHAAAVVDGAYLYIFGGWDGNVELGDLHRLDLHSQPMCWSRVVATNTSEAPVPRHFHSMAALNRRLYVYGGFDGTRWRGDVVALDLDTTQWVTVTTQGPVPGPRASATLTAFDGDKLLLFGGYDGEEFLGDLWVLHTVDATTGRYAYSWERIEKPVSPQNTHRPQGDDGVVVPSSPLLARRSGHAAEMVGPLMLVVGGRHLDGRHNDVQVLNTRDWTWSTLQTTGVGFQPRKTHALARVGSRLMLYGGHDGSRWLNDFHILDLAPLLTSATATARYSRQPNQRHAPSIPIPPSCLLVDFADMLPDVDLASGNLIGAAAAEARASGLHWRTSCVYDCAFTLPALQSVETTTSLLATQDAAAAAAAGDLGGSQYGVYSHILGLGDGDIMGIAKVGYTRPEVLLPASNPHSDAAVAGSSAARWTYNFDVVGRTELEQSARTRGNGRDDEITAEGDDVNVDTVRGKTESPLSQQSPTRNCRRRCRCGPADRDAGPAYGSDVVDAAGYCAPSSRTWPVAVTRVGGDGFRAFDQPRVADLLCDGTPAQPTKSSSRLSWGHVSRLRLLQDIPALPSPPNVSASPVTLSTASHYSIATYVPALLASRSGESEAAGRSSILDVAVDRSPISLTPLLAGTNRRYSRRDGMPSYSVDASSLMHTHPTGGDFIVAERSSPGATDAIPATVNSERHRKRQRSDTPVSYMPAAPQPAAQGDGFTDIAIRVTPMRCQHLIPGATAPRASSPLPSVCIRAHRAVLAARCPYFSSVFSSPFTPECAHEVALDETDLPTAIALLRYIYTDQLPPPDEIDALVLPLLVVAQRLSMTRLAALMQRHLEAQLDADTAPDILDAADTIAAAPLRAAAVSYMLQNWEQCEQSPRFIALRIDLLRGILSAHKRDVTRAAASAADAYEAKQAALAEANSDVHDRRRTSVPAQPTALLVPRAPEPPVQVNLPSLHGSGVHIEQRLGRPFLFSELSAAPSAHLIPSQLGASGSGAVGTLVSATERSDYQRLDATMSRRIARALSASAPSHDTDNLLNATQSLQFAVSGPAQATAAAESAPSHFEARHVIPLPMLIRRALGYADTMIASSDAVNHNGDASSSTPITQGGSSATQHTQTAEMNVAAQPTQRGGAGAHTYISTTSNSTVTPSPASRTLHHGTLLTAPIMGLALASGGANGSSVGWRSPDFYRSERFARAVWTPDAALHSPRDEPNGGTG